jgi:hypothetical protein
VTSRLSSSIEALSCEYALSASMVAFAKNGR